MPIENRKPDKKKKKRTAIRSQSQKLITYNQRTVLTGLTSTKQSILLVEGQPKEFVIDTGSPVTIFPPITTPKEKQETKKCFVDVNKNSIKFKCELMVEVKTKKSSEILPILSQPWLGLKWLDQLERKRQTLSEL